MLKWSEILSGQILRKRKLFLFLIIGSGLSTVTKWVLYWRGWSLDSILGLWKVINWKEYGLNNCCNEASSLRSYSNVTSNEHAIHKISGSCPYPIESWFKDVPCRSKSMIKYNTQNYISQVNENHSKCVHSNTNLLFSLYSNSTNTLNAENRTVLYVTITK